MTNLIPSSPVSQRTIAQRARREREIHQIQSPSVTQIAAQHSYSHDQTSNLVVSPSVLCTERDQHQFQFSALGCRTTEVCLPPHNQMTNLVASSSVSKRTIAQRARRERERHQFRFPSVTQIAAQRARREREKHQVQASSARQITAQHARRERERSASLNPSFPTLMSSSRFVDATTSEIGSHNMDQGLSSLVDSQISDHTNVLLQTGPSQTGPSFVGFSNPTMYDPGSSSSQPIAASTSQVESSYTRFNNSTSLPVGPYNNCSENISLQTGPSFCGFSGPSTYDPGSSSSQLTAATTTQEGLSGFRFTEPNLSNALHGDIQNTYAFVNEEEDFSLPEMGVPLAPILDLPTERHFLGRMDVECRNCSALHWLDERLSRSTRTTSLFGMCCLQGKIRLPLLSPLPPAFQSFYEDFNPLSNSFRKNIRSYNASNAFTSLGATIDDRILLGRGPTSFTIHGELRHRTLFFANSALQHRSLRNPHLRSDVLSVINATLLETNELCRVYQRAYEILALNDVADNEVSVSLHYTLGSDPRRYNLPSTDEIAVILPREGEDFHSTRDIILRLRSGPLQRISECHPAYWPLHYVLFFPNGDLGWHPEMKLWDAKNSCYTQRRLTQLQYYTYRLFERTTEYSTILRGGPLFQEFLVDAWAAYEQNRLQYVRDNQNKIRSDCYKGLIDSMNEGLSADQIGKRFILPSSHPGSPRNMYEIYQDSMAITRYYRHPDIFLTATANPNWPEIRNELKPYQTAYDRPDLVARVFELKGKAIMKEITDKGVLGRVAAYVYTVEFQKRGLPHMHALIFLHREDKIRTPAQVDKIVCAELPDPNINPVLFSTIISRMIHGPCGTRNPKASCMVDDHGRLHCRSKYPRAFVTTTLMDRDGYPTYKRTDTGQRYLVGGHEVDNRDVVPYNPYLSAMFDCHINVEVCASVRAVKYIHKYIYKGYDLTTLVVGDSSDEIQQYLDSRYIGSVEAAWHLFENPMHKESPNVERLPLHLKGMHHVSFNSRDTPADIEARAARQKSKLTAFFEYYRANPTAEKFTYTDLPQHFVWKQDQENSRWEPRQLGFAIGRMYFAKPNEGERFYLRLLLTVVKGPPSFESLYQVGSTVYSTYKDACIARGLLEHDLEWDICLEEASFIKTGYQLRRLFAIILTESSPLHPDQLWDKYALRICDDLPHKLRTSLGIEEVTEEQIKDYGLYHLDKLLLESGKTLSDYPLMPLPKERWSDESGNRLLSEQLQLRYDVSESDTMTRVASLNINQRCMFDAVTRSVSNHEGRLFFLNGAAGTGKTFAYNTIAAACRHAGHIAIMVASSGIASLLLSGGRTAHSTFKLPLDVLDDTMCGFSKQSIHAELFKQTDLIIWDEVPTQHRYCIEAVDRSLRDIRGNSKPFGGVTVVFGGDFCQTLPVIQQGLREEVVHASVSRSSLWENVHILSLTQNMRLQMTSTENVQFSEFLAKVGTTPSEDFQLPSDIYKCHNLNDLLSAVYPALNIPGTATSSFLKDRTILAPRNDEVREINDAALRLFPGEYIEYLGADKEIERDGDLPHTIPTYTTESLNALDPSSLPPFRLRLKVGSPIMLLRNIAPRDGLCNGTRLIVEHCATRVIEAKILTGAKAGETVFIPRITLSPTASELPIPMSRRQFPVRLAFAMTINKSQGQSVKYVGVDLQTPVFSHGQLYVALSRCTSSKNISVILPMDRVDTTVNIVYPEVLL